MVTCKREEKKKMKIVYKGPYLRGTTPEVGTFERGKEVEVEDSIAKQLLKSGQFKKAGRKEVSPT